MPDPIPACFRGGATGGPPPSTAAGPSLTTSIYETHLGLAALSWSRTVVGLSLRAELRLSTGDGGKEAAVGQPEAEEETLRFAVRPWLFWKRRGSRRFHLRDRRPVDVAWDLTRARFPPGGGPEPCAGFFVAVAVDGEMLLVAGDLADEAYRRTKAARSKSLSPPVLISKREHVVLGAGSSGGGRSYRTRARFGGREREISIDLGAREKERGEIGMSVAVDGGRVLQVRRLRWKFRGSERVEVDGGSLIQISWDLHNWFFQPPKDEAPSSSAVSAAVPGLGHAVFVFRFEKEAGEEAQGYFGKPACGGGEEKKGGDFRGMVWKGIGGYFGKSRNWSESSSGGGGGGGGGERRGKGRKKSLLKTSSSSSSSSASSASSSTVMEWASPEEAELRSADGFSLLVYAWKS